jgi:hypothetical protein
MSAPVTERTRTAAGTGAIPAQRRGTIQRPETQRSAVGAAARKAYDRRDERAKRVLGAGRGRFARPSAQGGRIQFVMLVMVLLAAGLVATLWLSTAAAADSYRLQDARATLQSLTAQSERLHRDVASMNSAPALAQRATQLGMVPVRDPARLLVAPSGAVTVVGQPMAAVAAAPIVAPVAGPVPGSPAPAAGTTAAPEATDPNAAPGGGAPAAALPGSGATPPAASPPAASPPLRSAPAAGDAGGGHAGGGHG